MWWEIYREYMFNLKLAAMAFLKEKKQCQTRFFNNNRKPGSNNVEQN